MTYLDDPYILVDTLGNTTDKKGDELKKTGIVQDLLTVTQMYSTVP